MLFTALFTTSRRIVLQHTLCVIKLGGMKPELRRRNISNTTQVLAHHDNMVEVQADAANYHWFWTETMNRLGTLERRVSDGEDYDVALHFSQHVIWSAMDKLLESHRACCGSGCPVDSKLLRKTAESLQSKVREKFIEGKGNPKRPDGQLEAIHKKLEILAAGIAVLTSNQELRRRNETTKESPDLCILPKRVLNS